MKSTVTCHALWNQRPTTKTLKLKRKCQEGKKNFQFVGTHSNQEGEDCWMDLFITRKSHFQQNFSMFLNK